MKARTKTQKIAVERFNALPSLSEAQKEWAKNVYNAQYYMTAKGGWCERCGQYHNHLLSEYLEMCETKKFVCPNCGAKLKATLSRKRQNKDRYYVSYLSTSGEYQVVRYYLVQVYTKKGERISYDYSQVQVLFITEKGNVTTFRRRLNYSYYRDSWGPSRVELMPNYLRYIPSHVYPKYKLLPTFQRNGFSHKIETPVDEALLGVLFDSKLETLCKVGYYGATRYDYSKYWKSIKICIRNKYKVTDWDLWCDYIDLLNRHGRDTLNAKFVCPKNLKVAHDREVLHAEKLRKKKEEEEKRAKARMFSEYNERMKIWSNLLMTDKKIIIEVLDTIDKVIQEGDKMHHCVYSNQYYMKTNSLLLSARDSKGNRLATIEYDLTEHSCLQVRGKFNAVPKEMAKIEELIRANKKNIIKCIKKK